MCRLHRGRLVTSQTESLCITRAFRVRSVRAQKLLVILLAHIVELTDRATVIAAFRGAIRSRLTIPLRLESLSHASIDTLIPARGARLHHFMQRQFAQAVLTEQERFRV